MIYIWTFLLLLFCISSKTIGTPFLYNAPGALTNLAASASASASDSSSPLNTNIADLRSAKSSKLVDDSLAENESTLFSSLENNMNEASPPLLQKKINKILTKLRLFSQLTNSGPSKADAKDEEFQKEFEDFDKEFEMEFHENASNETTKENKTSLYFYDTPERIDIDLDNFSTNEKQTNNKSGGLSLSPGAIGVFFLELIGSVVGLIYGAVAQMSNTQNTASSL